MDTPSITLDDLATATPTERWGYRTAHVYDPACPDSGRLLTRHGDNAEAIYDREFTRMSKVFGRRPDNHAVFDCVTVDGRTFSALFTDGTIVVGWRSASAMSR